MEYNNTNEDKLIISFFDCVYGDVLAIIVRSLCIAINFEAFITDT